MALKDGKYRIIEFVTYTIKKTYLGSGNFFLGISTRRLNSPLLVLVSSETSKSERPAQTQATKAHSLHTEFTPR